MLINYYFSKDTIPRKELAQELEGNLIQLLFPFTAWTCPICSAKTHKPYFELIEAVFRVICKPSILAENIPLFHQ